MQFSEQIIAIIDDLCRRFGIVIDWSNENIVPYVHDLCSRYIKYEIYSSIVTIIIWTLVLIALTVALKRAVSSFRSSGCDVDTFSCFMSIAIGVLIAVCGIIFLVVSCDEIFEIIECLTIPEKVLIEFVQSLMK